MATISFKSAGKTRIQQSAETTTETVIPVGLKTPLRFGVSNTFATHDLLEDQVHDNLRNLILTNYGERLGLYNFGANLRELTADFASQDDFDSAAVERINTAVSRWMPYVSLEEFISTIDRVENKNTGVIKLTITYTIPSLQTQKKALLVTLYVI